MPSSVEAIITFTEGENVGSEIRVQSPRELIIGRSEQCDIFVGEKKVSRRHARLLVKPEGVFIEDMDSTNGTFVDGKRVGTAMVPNGSAVRVGMTVFTVAVNDISVVREVAHEEPDAISAVSPDTAVPEIISGDNPVEGMDSLGEDLREEALPGEGEALQEDELPEPSQPGRQKEKKKPLSGNLSEMALPDLLQMLKNNSRSGVLCITKDDEYAEIFFNQGDLVSASMGEVSGLKAIYRMLNFNEGDFEFKPLPEKFSADTLGEKIDLSLENILIEGMRQIDEYEKIRKQLPPKGTRLEINRESSSPLSKLHPKVLDVFQLIMTHSEFGKVMNRSQLTDLETGKIIFYLLKKEYIKKTQ